MSHDYTLSKTGRRLIKSFEGFRPVDRTLINGQRVVGYGHKVRGDAAMALSKSEANDLLSADLGPYEDMINNEIYAPLSQNQFDALVSFAFSIGPRAFQNSPTLHLINNGRPLDAARSFEVWRKSRIYGKTYIVDALVRRRAAEKALFLTPEDGHVAAPRSALQSIEDTRLIADIMSSELPMFKGQDLGMVAQVPYEKADTEVDRRAPKRATPLAIPQRRKEDGPAGVLTLSEIVDVNDQDIFTDEADVFESEDADVETPIFDEPSPIAVAAAKVSDRLDALMEHPPETMETADWPESLITSESSDIHDVKNTLDGKAADEQGEEITKPELESIQETYQAEVLAEAKADAEAAERKEIADRIKAEANAQDDTLNSTAANDTAISPEFDLTPVERQGGLGPYLVMLVIGLTLIGASFGAMMRGGNTQFGESMPFWSGVGIIIGAVVLMAALYYLLKSILRRS